MNRKNSKQTFVKITNEDIYKEIQTFKESNSTQHLEITRRLDFTNGKVKLAMWIATTAIIIILTVLGFLFSHINK